MCWKVFVAARGGWLWRIDTAQKFMAKALTLTERADLAEEVSAYVQELGCKDSNSDLKKVANKVKSDQEIAASDSLG